MLPLKGCSDSALLHLGKRPPHRLLSEPQNFHEVGRLPQGSAGSPGGKAGVGGRAIPRFLTCQGDLSSLIHKFTRRQCVWSVSSPTTDQLCGSTSHPCLPEPRLPYLSNRSTGGPRLPWALFYHPLSFAPLSWHSSLLLFWGSPRLQMPFQPGLSAAYDPIPWP